KTEVAPAVRGAGVQGVLEEQLLARPHLQPVPAGGVLDRAREGGAHAEGQQPTPGKPHAERGGVEEGRPGLAAGRKRAGGRDRAFGGAADQPAVGTGRPAGGGGGGEGQES